MNWLATIRKFLKGQTPKSSETALFLGADHPGFYPHQASGADIAEWYRTRFGFKCEENDLSYFLSGPGAGRIEVMKAPLGTHCHIAIRVSNYEQAVAALEKQGVRFREPFITPQKKSVFLQETDPDGNLVHLL